MEWNHPDRVALEKKINDMEQWCIDKGYGNITQLTVWTEFSGNSNEYPWNTGFVNIKDIHMVGELNGKFINYNSDGSVHVS